MRTIHYRRTIVRAIAVASVTAAAIAQQTNTPSVDSSDNAEVAREAYDESDALPVENWFGCSPRVDSAAADDTLSENCDPDSPLNDSPAKDGGDSKIAG